MRSSRRSRETAWLLAAAALLAGAAPAAAAPPGYAGRPLAEVLLSLQDRGLAIVFTSELVRPEMKVLAEPAAAEPRAVLEEILAPHGLAVEEAPGGVLVVVAKAAGPAGRPAPSVEGMVLALESRRGVAGARVRVVESGLAATVRDDGSFSLTALEPGSYTLEASAPGYLEERIGKVSVAAGAPRRVVFHLRRRPVFHDEIVVQPSRLELLQEQPDASFSLDRDEIESLPHLGGDFFRTLSLLPGVAAGDVTAEPSLHGGRRDEVRILLDGQELYDAYHLKDYDSALSVVPARALGGASLTAGAYPASQGDRMSGVLDLRTANPPAGRHYGLGLSVLDALVSASGRSADDRSSWLLTGRRGSLELARRAIGDENPQFWDVLAKAERATRFGLFGARALAAGDELELDQSEAESFDRFENRYRSAYGWLTHQAAPGPRLTVETVGSWADVGRRRGGSGGDEEGSFELRDRRDLKVLALAQTWSVQLAPRHALLAGWEARRYDAFFDYAKELAPELVILAPFAPPRRTAHAFAGTLRGDHLGLWASDLATWRRLTAELGARYDRHSLTDDRLVSPRMSLAWRLGERGLLRAAWGRFFQSQRPYELQVEDGEGRLRPAELSQHWVLGAERLLAANRLGCEAVRLEIYRRRIRDPRPRYENLLEPLNFFPEVEPDRVLVAPDRSTAEGIELLLRGGRNPRFGWWLAYSYARSEDRLDGLKVPRALDQPHTLVLDLNLRPAGAWSMNLAWRYHTGWPTTAVAARRVGDPEEPELEAVFSRLRGERLSPYHRLDLRASRGWDLRAGRLTFHVDVQNLYDRRNLAGFDVRLDPGAGGLVLEKERWPGTFPSFGLAWDF